MPIKAIYATPLERTQETAAPLAGVSGLNVQVAEAITEVDYGSWTGRKVETLLNDPLWRQYHSLRSTVAIPGGESMLQIQARVVGFIENLRFAFPNEHIVLISHGDPIKAAVIHYMGMHLDSLFRFVIDPAGVTIVALNDHDVRVITLNNRHDRLCDYIE